MAKTLKLFARDVSIVGTMYIKARTKKEADELLRGKIGPNGVSIEVTDGGNDMLPVSSLAFNHPNLPKVSLSCMMSVAGPLGRGYELAQDNLPEPEPEES